MKDIYETRISKEHKLVNRQDEVVFGGLISKYDLDFYEKNGYLLIKDFFNKQDIDAALFEANKIKDDDCSYKNYELNNKKVRSALSVHNHDGIVQLAKDNELHDLSYQILGGRSYIHQSRINYKSDSESTGWSWHSDFETWHAQDGMERMMCFSAMIPLCKNTVENGCLRVIPKSHKIYYSAHKEDNEFSAEHNFSDQKEGCPSLSVIDEIIKKFGSEVVDVLCDVGDLLLFDCNIMHYSEANKSGEPRTNLFFVINSMKNMLKKPFSCIIERPEEMGHRKNIFEI